MNTRSSFRSSTLCLASALGAMLFACFSPGNVLGQTKRGESAEPDNSRLRANEVRAIQQNLQDEAKKKGEQKLRAEAKKKGEQKLRAEAKKKGEWFVVLLWEQKFEQIRIVRTICKGGRILSTSEVVERPTEPMVRFEKVQGIEQTALLIDEFRRTPVEAKDHGPRVEKKCDFRAYVAEEDADMGLLRWSVMWKKGLRKLAG